MTAPRLTVVMTCPGSLGRFGPTAPGRFKERYRVYALPVFLALRKPGTILNDLENPGRFSHNGRAVKTERVMEPFWAAGTPSARRASMNLFRWMTNYSKS